MGKWTKGVAEAAKQGELAQRFVLRTASGPAGSAFPLLSLDAGARAFLARSICSTYSRPDLDTVIQTSHFCRTILLRGIYPYFELRFSSRIKVVPIKDV